MPTITKRLLAFIFDLGKGSFGESGYDRLRIDGVRASAVIAQGGIGVMGHAEVSIFGLTLSHMNQLSTLGIRRILTRRNTLTIEAGDSEKGLSTVFQGQIVDGWADMSGAPQAAFRIHAFAGALEAVKPIPPTSIRGAADVATVMSGLATQAGLNFNNYGVDTKISNPYFPGTIRDQIAKCADAADINFEIAYTALSIWPKNKPRGSSVPLISPSTGMQGYPAFTSIGLQVNVLYNPSIRLGQRVKIEGSQLPDANGEWDVVSLAHALDSEMPNGQWFTRFVAAEPGYIGSPPPPTR